MKSKLILFLTIILFSSLFVACTDVDSSVSSDFSPTSQTTSPEGSNLDPIYEVEDYATALAGYTWVNFSSQEESNYMYHFSFAEDGSCHFFAGQFDSEEGYDYDGSYTVEGNLLKVHLTIEEEEGRELQSTFSLDFTAQGVVSFTLLEGDRLCAVQNYDEALLFTKRI